MRVGCAFALVGCALALAGCGTSPRQQVEAKVQQFAHATASKDYAALCDDVLAPALVAHLKAAGLSCRQAMKIFVSSVQNPTIRISRVSVAPMKMPSNIQLATPISGAAASQGR